MPNRLARETSPYLQQHADNPVDWYPWGDEAFARAHAEDKPVLLSVGYSACHWCHVMAHESFEDEATAKVMNELFINIKVDREERPDVDGIYMQAVQAFSQGHGGWPMTVFMTPDGRPFFGGTYYPPQPRQGMPSFTQVMRHIESIWANRRDEVHEVGEQLREILTPRPSSPEAAGPHWLDDVVDSALQVLDPIHGGFGTAPKFPPHGTLPALLVQAWRTRDPRVVDALRGTLDGMARGGTYDHLRGGFARYSVDAEWRIPHFEKMLYDNGQLLHTYTSAWQLTKAPHYARIVAETVGWLREEMTLDGGAFAAALDADSEGEEGRFYVWTPDQLREVLGDAAERVAKLCQVTSEGTFEHGASVLRLEDPVEALPLADQALLERSFPKLLAARDTRVAPGRDDKIIVAWNALVIGALARAGAAFDQPTWIDDAVRAWNFLARHLVVDERWQRTFKDGRAHVPAMADDHANLLDAALHLYEATFDPAWLDRAEALADTLLALFWDDEHGGLFETGADAEALLVRPKKLDGGSEPAANGTAALGFAKLAVFRGRDDLGERADTMLANYASLLKQAARVVGTEALAALWRSGAVRELAIVGPPDQTAPLARVVRERFQPVTAVACAPESATTGIPWLAQRTAGPSALAYLCAHGACQLPVDSPEALAEQLDAVAISVLADTRRSKVRVRAPELPSDPALWLNTDAPLQLAALEGQVVVLDFWTHCCINCHHVLPALAAIEERFADAPVAVIGVHSAKFPAEKELQHVQSAIERQRVAHPVVNDAEHTLWDAYAVRSWPTLVIIDSTGRVAWQKGGEVSAETLSVEVERLLAEGRADGTLADGPVWSPPLRPTATPELAFPGKASVWPTPIHQQNGAEPFGPDSRLYISDTGNDRILEATLVCGPDGWPRADVVRRWGLIPGLVDGKGLQARFHMPQGLRRAGDTLWVADTENHAIRAIHLPTGIVRTAAGTGSLGRGGRITVDQPTRVALRSPWDVAPAIQTLDGEATAVFIAMAGTHQIWVHNPSDDDLGPLAGSGRENHIDGALPEAALAQPSGLALYGSSLFFADSEVSSIRVVDLQEGQVGTLVGQGLFDFGDVDGAPDQALLQHPLGLATDGETVWVADTYNGKIKAIDLSTGHIRTLCDGLTDPGSVDVAGEFLIVADTGAHRLVAVHTHTGECRQVYLTGL